MWNSEMQQSFDFYFSVVSASINKGLILENWQGTWLQFNEVLKFPWPFLIL